MYPLTFSSAFISIAHRLGTAFTLEELWACAPFAKALSAEGVNKVEVKMAGCCS